MAADTWPKVVVTALASPVLVLALSALFIPGIVEDSNRTEALKTSRLRKSIDVGDRNREFTSKLHVLKTRMQTFNTQNVRGKPSLNQLRKAQKQFQEKYTEQYLALDEMAWWWYWDVKREAQAFNLLSPSESERMHKLIADYGENVAACVGALHPLWSHLSSSEYSLRANSQKTITAFEATMNSRLGSLDSERLLLVNEIARMIAQSQYDPSQASPAS
ncbi:MAG TPA: hypothetical protein VN643_20215 [Pyrinomonadaceae bacterium]|nr:hypothetical protein [Pyrinomonadaceae bacterium]